MPFGPTPLCRLSLLPSLRPMPTASVRSHAALLCQSTLICRTVVHTTLSNRSFTSLKHETSTQAHFLTRQHDRLGLLATTPPTPLGSNILHYGITPSARRVAVFRKVNEGIKLQVLEGSILLAERIIPAETCSHLYTDGVLAHDLGEGMLSATQRPLVRRPGRLMSSISPFLASLIRAKTSTNIGINQTLAKRSLDSAGRLSSLPRYGVRRRAGRSRSEPLSRKRSWPTSHSRRLLSPLKAVSSSYLLPVSQYSATEVVSDWSTARIEPAASIVSPFRSTAAKV